MIDSQSVNKSENILVSQYILTKKKRFNCKLLFKISNISV